MRWAHWIFPWSFQILIHPLFPACTISGTVFHYCLQQVCLWALLHAVFLFWGVAFPFSYRQLRVTKRIRYAHVISVLLAVILPLPGALVPLKDGFVSTRNPTLTCVGRNTDHVYYTLILPLSIVIGISSYLLLLTTWTILKVCNLVNV